MPNIQHPVSGKVREVRPEQVPLYAGSGWVLTDDAPGKPAAKKAPAKKAAAKKAAKKK